MVPKVTSATWALILPMLVMFPPAEAAPSEGAFTVRSVTISPSVEGEVVPLAAYLGNASQVSGFELNVPSGFLSVHQAKFLRVPTPRGPAMIENVVGTRNQTWALRDATLRILGGSGTGEQPRFFALDPMAGMLDIWPTSHTTLEPSADSSFGSVKWMYQNATPESHEYFVREVRPHLRLDAPCQARYVGLGGVKLSGLKVEVSSPQNATPIVYTTGRFETSPVETTITYLYVSFDEPATLTLDTGQARLEIAAANATISGEGLLAFDPIAGELRTPEGRYLASGAMQHASVEGAFELALAPVSGGKVARMALRGDFQPSGMLLKPVPAPVDPRQPRWVLLFGAALLAATLAGAAGGVGTSWEVVRRARAMSPPAPQQLPFSVEDCMEVARAALEQEDYPEAMDWLRRAEALAPASARIAADLAFCLEQVGGADEALEWYAKAHARSTDGEAAFNAARAARDANQPPELVLHWLAHALERAPALVEEVPAEFPAAVGLPTWAAIEARARARRHADRTDEEPGHGGSR